MSKMIIRRNRLRTRKPNDAGNGADVGRGADSTAARIDGASEWRRLWRRTIR